MHRSFAEERVAQLEGALATSSPSASQPEVLPPGDDTAARKAWREARLQGPGIQSSLVAKLEQAQDAIRASSGTHAGTLLSASHVCATFYDWIAAARKAWLETELQESGILSSLVANLAQAEDAIAPLLWLTCHGKACLCPQPDNHGNLLGSMAPPGRAAWAPAQGGI